MDVQNVRVSLGTGYDISIGGGLLDNCGEMLSALLGQRKFALASDSNVAPLYAGRVCDSLKAAGFEVCAMTFPAGEASKNMDTLSGILDFFAVNGMTRGDCAAALGGGVVGDLTGLAAGLYMRGIDYVQLPTTLLAAVDSSVGGKTAVDLPTGKNLAGLFIQPKAVICDTDCLKTLSPEIISDGAAEAIKTGILGDKLLFEIFESGESFAREAEIIRRCVEFKARVVEADERETGERRLLNLGHTIGHAIEKCSRYTVSHGHAVAMGTAIISAAGAKLGLCSQVCADRIRDTLVKNGLPVSTDFSACELANAALSDKKRLGNGITLVFPREIGRCTLETVSVDRLEDIFHAGMERRE